MRKLDEGYQNRDSTSVEKRHIGRPKEKKSAKQETFSNWFRLYRQDHSRGGRLTTTGQPTNSLLPLKSARRVGTCRGRVLGTPPTTCVHLLFGKLTAPSCIE